MAFSLVCDSSETVSIEAVIDFVNREVDLRDAQSLLACAPMMRGLANDRALVVRQLNRQIKEAFQWDSVPSSQVIFLGGGKDFFLRANLWPSTAEIASGKVFQDNFSYYVGHDHNYHFLTTPYMGPGYVTELYEWDSGRIQGYLGESVDLRFLERRHFCGNQVMVYRAGIDVHVQYPPDELSITLNLLAFSPEVRLSDQYLVDVEKRVLLGPPEAQDSFRRVTMLEIAGYAGNADTLDLLEHLSRRHPSRRTRLSALNAMSRLAPWNLEHIWTPAADDPAALVADAARSQLARLESN